MTKVCVITGSRAEYDLLFFLMKEFQSRAGFDLQIIVTGSHLVDDAEPFFERMREDGLEISGKVDMMLASNLAPSVAKSVGLGVIGISSELERLKPDLVVILGDRFEALAAAQSAMIQNIPIAHIHGGEATEGLIDEAIRHSITKMSRLFVAAQKYHKRVVQLGENPRYVFNVGAMALDNISSIDFEPKQSIETELGIKLSSCLFLVTYHPLTLNVKPDYSLDFLLSALDKFPRASVIFTGSNVDPGGVKIDLSIQKYVQKNKERMGYRSSFGRKKYLSIMNLASVVIGNSSSGLIEAPSIGVPSVNIGPRQDGRIRGGIRTGL